jgi:glutamate decarboxylase
VALQISSAVAEMGPFELLSEGRELPVFAFKLRDGIENYSVFDVSDRLRQAGWLVPAYTFPDNLTDMAVLRVVVRAGMTSEMADLLIGHFREATDFLESLEAPLPGEHRKAFAHN